MKLAMKLELAGLISLFTIILYWCGYVYVVGQLSFYNYNIDAFDLVTPSFVITGFFYGVKLYSLFGLLIISYFCIKSFSKNQKISSYEYFVSLLFRLFFLIFYILYLLGKFIIFLLSRPPLIWLIWSVFWPIGLLTTLYNKYEILQIGSRSEINKKRKELISLVSKEYQKFKSKLSENLINMNLTVDQIRNSYPIENNAPNFLNNIFKYFLTFLFFTFTILAFVSAGQELIKEGENDSEIMFKATKMPLTNKESVNKRYKQVYITNTRNYDKSQILCEGPLFDTNICLKGLCLITDLHGNVQPYKSKDIKKINNFE